MSWGRLLTWAAVAVALDAALRLAWKRGFLSGSDSASEWWQGETTRRLVLRDLEWQRAMAEGMTLEEQDLVASPIGEWLN